MKSGGSTTPLLLGLVLGGCQCDSDELRDSLPFLIVEPERIDFGEVEAGASKVRQISLRNEGETTLQVLTSLAVEDDRLGFAVAGETFDHIPVSEEVTLMVHFVAGSGLGLITTNLIMDSDAKNLPSLSVTLVATVVERNIPPECGDGTVNVGELCDDGNLDDGDGCDSNCTISTCGNGVVTAGEHCDDGNGVDDDGCDSNCTVTGCGNGVVTVGEVCDDGNTVDGDGCRGQCNGFEICGDGLIDLSEGCDDGNLVGGDGCSDVCVPESVCGPIQFDPTFGSNGRAVYYVPGCDYDSSAVTMAMQRDGKVILGGRYYVEGKGRMMSLLRIDSDGQPDTSFSDDGFVNDLYDEISGVYGVGLQTDDKIVVAGSVGGRLAVLRLNPSGSLDSTFNANGRVEVQGVSVHYFAASMMAIQSDGRIVAVGTRANDFAVVRLLPSGALDTSFGEDGVRTVALTNEPDHPLAVAVQDDGKIVVAGDAAGTFGVARLMPDGSLDASFGGTGFRSVDVSPGVDWARGLDIQPDGAIVLAGCGNCSLNYNDDVDWALVRLDSAGELDPAFGSGGVVLERVPSSLISGVGVNDSALNVTVLPTGKLLVYGYTKFNSGEGRMLISRYNTDGTLDSCFDTDGYFPVSGWPSPAFSQSDRAHAAMVKPDGSILLVGTVNPSAWGYKAAVQIYQPE